MRTLLLLLFFSFCTELALAQQIDYKIPEGYESDISKKDYRKLLDASLKEVSKRFKVDYVADGSIFLKEGEELQALNVHNLILKCVAEKDKNQWNAIIHNHFNNLFLSLDEQNKINPEDFESIRPYLSLRIYPVAFMERQGGTGNHVARTDLEGTYTMLMLDLPGVFTSVRKEVFDTWNKSEAEVFAIAQQNVNSQEMEKVTQSFEVDKSSIEISFLGNEDYAASFTLDLSNNSPELLGEWGAVLAMPNKGLVNLCKVSPEHPLDFVKYIQLTKMAVQQSYDRHPQPISTEYFWYYGGRFTKIEVVQDEKGNINVISPPGLTELMTAKK